MGMQPQFRQMPPRCAFSTTAVLKPSWAARMAVTISCDHRVMDGAMGARFLQDVKRLLEEPLRLLV